MLTRYSYHYIVWFVFCLAVGQKPSTSISAWTPPDEPAADTVRAPKPPRDLRYSRMYAGKVAAVGLDWVELGPGWKAYQIPEEEKLDVAKPKRLSGSGTYPGGELNGPDDPGYTHFLADVKIGDQVGVFVGIHEKLEWVTAVHIERRPGGRVPPMAPDQFGDRSTTFTERYQAEQDWEEKGVPIPQKHLPAGGRATHTNPPYPPVAPQPRPVKP